MFPVIQRINEFHDDILEDSLDIHRHAPMPDRLAKGTVQFNACYGFRGAIAHANLPHQKPGEKILSRTPPPAPYSELYWPYSERWRVKTNSPPEAHSQPVTVSY